MYETLFLLLLGCLVCLVTTSLPNRTFQTASKQLPHEQQVDLVEQLYLQPQASVDANAWIAAFQQNISDNEIAEAPSIRREDWYGDDGR